MNTPQELADKMAAKTDRELQAMFSRPDEWTLLALDAARAELQRRNLSPIEVAAQPAPKEWDIESVKHRRKIWLTFLFVDLAALVTFTFIFGSGAAIVAHAVCVAIFLSLYLPVAKRVLNPSDYSVTGTFIGTLLFPLPLLGWAYADRKIYDAIRQKESPLTSTKPQLSYEILPSGRKRFLKATEVDISVSIFLPGWGLIVGALAFFIKGEKKRGSTMMATGACVLFLIFISSKF